MNTTIIERMAKHFKARGDQLSLDTLKFSLARPVLKVECDEEQARVVFEAKRNDFITKCQDLSTVILYGAGTEGVAYFGELQKNGVKIAAFMDTFKTGTFCGKPIIPMEEYKEKFADTTIVITPRLPKQEIKRTLESNRIRSILYFDSDAALMGLDFISPDAEKLFRASGGEQYFSLPEMHWGNDEVFVDCGSFGGESSLDFMKNCEKHGVSYHKIFAFELDSLNMHAATDSLSRFRDITLFNAGVGNHDGVEKFEMQASGSHVTKDGTAEARIVTLNKILRGEKVTFIKMDIEGSELAALQGASEIIRTQRPKLAICVYHKYEDIWEIPEYIWSLHQDYQFFIRHYSEAFGETVLYALP